MTPLHLGRIQLLFGLANAFKDFIELRNGAKNHCCHCGIITLKWLNHSFDWAQTKRSTFCDVQASVATVKKYSRVADAVFDQSVINASVFADRSCHKLMHIVVVPRHSAISSQVSGRLEIKSHAVQYL